MSDKIQSILDSVKNPITGQTMSSESRWNEVSWKDDKLHINYTRDGIGPAEKRLIEAEILAALKNEVTEDRITIMTISKSSADVYASQKSAPPEEAKTPAQIKTGHGPVSNKKPVPNVNKLVAIGSGKGGVGKSTFTVNLACTLARMGKKVGIIDGDIYGPSVPMLMGKRKDKPVSNSNKKIVPLEAYGVKFMSFGLFIEENDPVIWRGPMLGGVLNQFLFDVEWGELDYLFIDLPPGTGDIQLSMVQNSHVDGAIVISTPQDVALLDATKGLEMFRKLQIPIVGMVENMSKFICDGCGKSHALFGDGGVKNAVQKLDVPFLGEIPLELELRLSADQGMPYMSRPELQGRAVYNAYQSIGQRVSDFFTPPVNTDASKGLFSRLFGG